MMHQRVELARLVASAQPRPLVTEAVDKLASSIRDVGLIQPITVKACSMMIGGLAGKGFQIVAGHHRVAACRALGWTEIDAIVIEAGEHLQAELIEIDENLCRSELTAAQRSKAIKRRKEIWEALHPVKPQRFDSVMDAPGTVEGPMTEAEEREEILGGKTSPTQKATEHKDRPQNQPQFAAATAAITGESKRSINQHLARAEALGDDLDRVAGTSLDKGVELDALAKLPEEQRAPLIERAQAGEKVTARPETAHEAPVAASPVHTTTSLIAALESTMQYLLDSTGCDTVTGAVTLILSTFEAENDHEDALHKALTPFIAVGHLEPLEFHEVAE